MDSAWVEEDRRFRFVVAEVAHQLNEQDRESLVYTHRLSASYKHASALDVLEQLEMLGIFSPSSPMKLVELLKNLRREDLAKDVEKRIKKDMKAMKKKTKDYQIGKLPCMAKEALLKARFDHLCLQATQLIEHLENLMKDLKEEGEEHHWQADPLLCECKEQAGEVVRKLKEARSAAEVSERALEEKLRAAALQGSDSQATRKATASPAPARRGSCL